MSSNFSISESEATATKSLEFESMKVILEQLTSGVAISVDWFDESLANNTEYHSDSDFVPERSARSFNVS